MHKPKGPGLVCPLFKILISQSPQPLFYLLFYSYKKEQGLFQLFRHKMKTKHCIFLSNIKINIFKMSPLLYVT